MAEHPALAPLEAAVRDLCAWLAAENLRAVIIGGVAASLLGRPRLTHDIDGLVIVEESRWAPILAAAKSFRIEARIDNALEFAAESRMMLLRHRPSGIDLDLSLGAISFEEQVVQRSVERDIGETTVRVPEPEDLVVMKAIANRPRDLVDIEGIVGAHPGLDRERIRSAVAEFAETLGSPGILADLDAIFDRLRD